MSNTSKRLLYSLVVLLCMLLLPWFVTVLLVFVGFLLWRWFLEGVVVFVLLDLIYGTSSLAIFGYPVVFSSAALVVFGIIEILKTRMRSHAF